MSRAADSSLEQRILDLESAQRAARTADPFGQITADDPTAVALTGTASTVGQVGWVYGNPVITLYVKSGRLRVDVAAALVASGNKASAYISWQILGPAATAEDAPSAAEVVAPAFSRAVEVQHSHAGQDQRGAAGTFGLHTGLAPGFYRVRAAYNLTYSSTTTAPTAEISNRRLAVMPY